MTEQNYVNTIIEPPPIEYLDQFKYNFNKCKYSKFQEKSKDAQLSKNPSVTSVKIHNSAKRFVMYNFSFKQNRKVVLQEELIMNACSFSRKRNNFNSSYICT